MLPHTHNPLATCALVNSTLLQWTVQKLAHCLLTISGKGLCMDLSGRLDQLHPFGHVPVFELKQHFVWSCFSFKQCNVTREFDFWWKPLAFPHKRNRKEVQGLHTCLKGTTMTIGCCFWPAEFTWHERDSHKSCTYHLTWATDKEILSHMRSHDGVYLMRFCVPRR